MKQLGIAIIGLVIIWHAYQIHIIGNLAVQTQANVYELIGVVTELEKRPYAKLVPADEIEYEMTTIFVQDTPVMVWENLEDPE